MGAIEKSLRRYGLLHAKQENYTVRFAVGGERFVGTVIQVAAEQFTIIDGHANDEYTFGLYDVDDLTVEKPLP